MEVCDGYLPFGKRAHDLGMVTDECWVDAVHLNEVSHKLCAQEQQAIEHTSVVQQHDTHLV